MNETSVPAKRLYIIFAGPRSGSNYLVGRLARIPGAIALSEVFNPRAAFGLNQYPELEAVLNEAFGSPEATLRAFRRTPVEAVTQLLALAPGGGPVFIKIQPSHIHSIAVRQILQEHGAGAILLTRNRLDQFVSLCKAQESSTWFGTDTTDLRPVADCEAYLSWVTRLETWLRDMVALCEATGKPAAYLNYERDLKTGSAAEIANRICDRLAPLPFPVDPQNLADKSWLVRQDLGEDPFKKISNGAELRTELERFGLIDEALAAPQLEADPVAKTPVPDVIADPEVGAKLIRQGDFETLRAALDRIGHDVAPGTFRPAHLPSSDYGFRKFTFICGLHRSGTTLLHDHIAARFDVATLRNATAPRNEGQFLQDVLPQEAPFGGPGHFAFAPQMVPPPVRDRRQSAGLAARLCGTWAAQADRPEHPHLLEKSPTNLTRIAFLRSVFPAARFVIIVRDPRAVALATRKWRPASLDSLLAHWQAAHLAALPQMAADCHVLRYEDFCADPEASLERIGAFGDLVPRAQTGELPDTAINIRDRNADYLRQWPPDLYFAPDLKAWEIFGYHF